MNAWEWESFESVITPFLFVVTNTGPLLGPIRDFRITRDSKRRLNLETLVVGEPRGITVDHPAGTVRRPIETIELAGASGQTCVAHGVLPRSQSVTHDIAGVKNTREKSGIYSVKALLRPEAEPAYIIEWIENLDRENYIWSGSTIVDDKNSIVDTRTIDNGMGEIILRSDRSGSSMNTSGAKLTVNGNELYIFSAGPSSNENLIGPGFIIYRGNPDEDVRKKIRNSLSFCLGSYLVYLGCTVLSHASEIVSLTAIDAPGVDTRIFDIPATPPAPLGQGYQYEVDQQTLSRMVNAIYIKYDDLQFSELCWAYWHAVCAPMHMAPVHFGATIEALQRACGRILPGGHQFNLVSDKGKWRSLRNKICQTIAEADLEQDIIGVLQRKVVSSLNQMPQGMAVERFLRGIGIELSPAESSAWTKRHVAAHGGETADDAIVDFIRYTKLLRLILNRIVLRITGASDSYFDYYTVGHPVRKLTEPVP